MQEITYQHEPHANRIVAASEDGQELGEIVYVVNDHYWNAKHTWVNPDYRGYNIARKLVNTLAEIARVEGVKILPTCSYAKHVMETDAAFADILIKKETL